MAASARRAFDAGQISASAFASLQNAAGERERTSISLSGQLQTAEISLATLLGLGLPPLGTVPRILPMKKFLAAGAVLLAGLAAFVATANRPRPSG